MSGLIVPRGVGVVALGDAIYVATLPDGPILVLDAVAALVWREALAGPEADAAARVTAQTDASLAEVAPAVATLIDDLVARGLLSRS